MKIFLMRHGQTTGDIEERFGGDYDDHLTNLGKTQTQDLAYKLDSLGIEKIFYSPRIRATETAEIIKQIDQIPIEKIEDLRERNSYGILTGKLKQEAKEKYPELIEELKNPKATIAGAETYIDFKARVLSIFNDIAATSHESVGIVTHGGVISCFLREALGRERKTLDDCALIELNYIDGQFEIIKFEGMELES